MAQKSAQKSKPRPSTSRRSNCIAGMQSRARGSTDHLEISDSSNNIKGMIGKKTSFEFLKLKCIIASLKSLGNNEDVIASLLAKHDFENEELLEIMFGNLIRSISSLNVDELSGASTGTRKGMEKVVETPVFKKRSDFDDGRMGDYDKKLYANFKRKLICFVA